MSSKKESAEAADRNFVVVASRLPVDRVEGPDGRTDWQTSPGGLVTALEHGEVGYSPVHYLHQSFPREEMAALYLAAEVMLVTPLRDGMNLVAKEYVACRNDENGTLVLSEFTGAADELAGAFLVNPHDIEGLKDAIVRAANTSPAEARRRMRAMRKRVREHDVARWAASFLDTLSGAPVRISRPGSPRPAGLAGPGQAARPSIRFRARRAVSAQLRRGAGTFGGAGAGGRVLGGGAAGLSSRGRGPRGCAGRGAAGRGI